MRKDVGLRRIVFAVVILIAIFQGFCWGAEALSASEQGCCLGRAEIIGEKWKKGFMDHGSQKDGRVKAGYETYLVVDTKIPAMWLEDKGQIIKNAFTELPEKMDWKLCRTMPGGSEELSSVIRLKIRGMWLRKTKHEEVWVVGSCRGAKGFGLSIKPGNVATHYYPFASWPMKYNSGIKKDKSVYKSIVVDDAEWRAYQRKFGVAILPKKIEQLYSGPEGQWLACQKQLLEKFEQEALSQGYKLDRIGRLKAGKDFNSFSGSMEIIRDYSRSNSNKPVLRLHQKNILTVRRLVEDLWYVKCYSDLWHALPNYEFVDFDFLFSDGERISSSRQEKLLAGLRDKYRHDPPINPNWQVKLENGVMVELLGICRGPSPGGKWWGASGKPLGYEPDIKANSKSSDDSIKYDTAFRVFWPKGVEKSQTHFKTITQGVWGNSDHGRGGLHFSKQMSMFSFGASQKYKSVDIQVSIEANGGNESVAVFKNIPLSLGLVDGFKVIQKPNK